MNSFQFGGYLLKAAEIIFLHVPVRFFYIIDPSDLQFHNPGKDRKEESCENFKVPGIHGITWGKILPGS